MSRIGKKAITVPAGVTVKVGEHTLEVKGPKGTLTTPIPEGIAFRQEGDQLLAERASDELAAAHGLARALANNAITGVTQGFSKQMDIVGAVPVDPDALRHRQAEARADGGRDAQPAQARPLQGQGRALRRCAAQAAAGQDGEIAISH